MTAIDTGFVGRSTELALLQQLLDGARAGRAATVLVGGDPGIGKSSLLAEAAGRFGARTMIAPCVRMGGAQIPLAPLVTLPAAPTQRPRPARDHSPARRLDPSRV